MEQVIALLKQAEALALSLVLAQEKKHAAAMLLHVAAGEANKLLPGRHRMLVQDITNAKLRAQTLAAAAPPS